MLGFKQPADALGKMLKWDDKHVPIVGVFRDFHAHPLNYKIAPMAFVRNAEQSRVMLASLPADHTRWPSIIAKMKKTFTAAYPGEEFKYEFLDESITNAYGECAAYFTAFAMGHGPDDLYQLPGSARSRYLYHYTPQQKKSASAKCSVHR